MKYKNIYKEVTKIVDSNKVFNCREQIEKMLSEIQ